MAQERPPTSAAETAWMRQNVSISRLIHEVRKTVFQPGHWDTLERDRLRGSSVLMMYVGRRANCHGNAYFTERPLNQSRLCDTLARKYLILKENQLSFQVLMRIPDLLPAHLIGSARIPARPHIWFLPSPLQINGDGFAHRFLILGPCSVMVCLRGTLFLLTSNFHLGKGSHTFTSCGNPFSDPFLLLKNNS